MHNDTAVASGRIDRSTVLESMNSLRTCAQQKASLTP